MQAITQHIQKNQDQRITFAEFMDLALYHPQFGYYSTRDSIIGPQGDFVTSPHMGHDFGEVVAEQFVDMWETLGRPARFDLVEMGAGQGLVAEDAIAHIQSHYPDCFATLNYIIVEKSAALKAEQQKRLSHWNDRGISVSWQSLDAIAPNTIIGCAFSNELIDAFPVHWVELHPQTLQGTELKGTELKSQKRQSQKLQEVYVVYNENGFASQLGELSTPKLESYFQQINIDFSQYSDGYRTEVNLAALDWIQQITDKLDRGYLLTIDYGYTAERYYSPARREGTLQCYYRHAHHNDPFIYVGEQDITAHVNFTALERKGDELGLQTLGFTQQGLFLMALGLGDRLGAIASPSAQSSEKATAQNIQSIMMRRDALQQLISPMGLGNFGVLIQSKGLSQKEIARPLKGLTIPPMA